MHCCSDLTSDERVVRRWGTDLLGSLCKPTSRPWLAKYCLVSLIPLGNAVLETVSSSEVSCQTPPLTRMSMPSFLARAAYFSRLASVLHAARPGKLDGLVVCRCGSGKPDGDGVGRSADRGVGKEGAGGGGGGGGAP